MGLGIREDPLLGSGTLELSMKRKRGKGALTGVHGVKGKGQQSVGCRNQHWGSIYRDPRASAVPRVV